MKKIIITFTLLILLFLVVINLKKQSYIIKGNILEIDENKILLEIDDFISPKVNFEVDQIVSIEGNFDENFRVGQIVEVTYTGFVRECNPPLIKAHKIVIKG